MPDLLIPRLKSLIAQHETNPRALAVMAGLKPDVVRDILRGKNKNPSAEIVAAIAHALGASSEYLVGSRTNMTLELRQSRPATGAIILGKVQAGAFMQIESQDEAAWEDAERISTVNDVEFPRLQQVAFEIVGDSVNRLCAAGGYAICIDFAETGLRITSGMVIVAERRRGDLIERTVKVVNRTNGGSAWELRPDSTNSKHTPISFPSADPSEEVFVRFLVRRFLTPSLSW